MPIKLDWYDETKEFLIMSYEGVWTADDFINMIEDAVIATNDIKHPFVTISNYSDSDTPPMNLLSMRNKVRNYHSTPYHKANLLVQAGSVLSVMSQIFGIVSKQNNRTVPSFEEALILGRDILDQYK